jgi:AraC-like DNA-binding protein
MQTQTDDMLYPDLLIRLCKAREILRDFEQNERPIPEIARQAGISRFHFIRLYAAVFGQTPHQCRIEARLDRARRLLTTTDSSVTDICFEVGFESLGTFTSLFTRRIGVSPSNYRRRMRQLQKRRGEIPAELIPGCLCLMSGTPTKMRNFQEAR